MTLASGTTLGPYEIVAPLGAGGMGEVYRAKDTRLDRDVAIKVLPEMFSRDPEREARFQREAKVLASLNHPNIAAIYGFEEHETKRFLVMELVEGETLSQRLKAGNLATEDTLNIGKQIAEALEAAHERGVIHRDLKPANVMIRKDGSVKVLDFGLAKAMAGGDDRSQSAVASSPTITADFTRAGVILGTAAYMSPEQARGKPLDKRTDIWSFGCVLYECLGGRRPFDGETATDLIAKILEREPDWENLPPATPPVVRALIQRCLKKDRRERLRDIGEAWVVLNGALSGELSGLALTGYDSRPAASPARRLVPWVLAGVMTIVSAASLDLYWRSARPADQPVMRLTFSIPEDETLAASRWPMFDISPDGTRVVYVGRGASDRQLFLRRTNQLDASPLPNTTGAHTPFFSPDSQWIAFYQQRKLKKVSVLGGPAVTICDAANMRGGSWSVNGTIVFAPEIHSGVSRVSSAGGKPEKLTDVGAEEKYETHRWPHFLPDGKTVLFTASPDDDNYQEADIVALSLDTMDRKIVLHGGTFPRYAPSGHLLFYRSGTLMAVPFDAATLEITTEPVPVLEGVLSVQPMGSAQYTFSRAGTLVYLAGTASGDDELLVWLDRSGQESPLSEHRRDYRDPDISPDGTRLAIRVYDGTVPPDIWILEIERDVLMRLTFDDAADTHPVWSPDGQWIVFASERDRSTSNVYRRRADGTGDVERLTNSENRQVPASYSPDGSLLVFVERTPDAGPNIMLQRLDEDEHKPEAFWATSFDEFHPSVSPDGKWLAYVSNESGEYEVYIQPFPGGGRRVKISAGVGFFPKWSPDGSEIFYRDTSRGLMFVPVSAEESTLKAGTPRLLIEAERGKYMFWYDVAPDGKRFVFGRQSGEDATQFRQPTVVVNWFEELKAKVPTGRDR